MKVALKFMAPACADQNGIDRSGLVFSTGPAKSPYLGVRPNTGFGEISPLTVIGVPACTVV